MQSRDEPHDIIVDEIIAKLPKPLGIAAARRKAMTAPLRQPLGEPIVVPVALGARAYDIVIGRGLIASLGARIKALRPGAKCRDRHRRDRRQAPSRRRRGRAEIGGHRKLGHRGADGEGSKSYATFETVARRSSRRASSAAISSSRSAAA